MLYKARSNQSSRKQRCMKTLGECWEFMTDTQVALSERSSTPRPCSLGAHSLIETTTVSSSNSLMCLSWVRMKSGNSLWKHSPKQTAPQPVRHASVAKSSGLETMTLEGITETPLYCERKYCHQFMSARRSEDGPRMTFELMLNQIRPRRNLMRV